MAAGRLHTGGLAAEVLMSRQFRRFHLFHAQIIPALAAPTPPPRRPRAVPTPSLRRSHAAVPAISHHSRYAELEPLLPSPLQP